MNRSSRHKKINEIQTLDMCVRNKGSTFYWDIHNLTDANVLHTSYKASWKMKKWGDRHYHCHIRTLDMHWFLLDSAGLSIALISPQRIVIEGGLVVMELFTRGYKWTNGLTLLTLLGLLPQLRL